MYISAKEWLVTGYMVLIQRFKNITIIKRYLINPENGQKDKNKQASITLTAV